MSAKAKNTQKGGVQQLTRRKIRRPKKKKNALSGGLNMQASSVSEALSY